MLGDRYIVERGDSLWKIAAKTLGGGKQWPRIWRYNNRPAVVRVTGRSIPNPDLIYVGQLLLIPRLPTERMTSGDPNDASSMSHLATAGSTPAVSPLTPDASKLTSRQQPVLPHQRSLSEQLQRIRSPLSFKYRLDMRWPAQDVGTAVLEVRATGDFILMTKKSYPATYVTSRGEIEHQVAREAHQAYGKLISDQRFVFEPAQKRLTYRSMLVTQSTTPNAPASAVGIEMSSNSPIPKLRAEIRIPKLEGAIGAFRYMALDNKFVVEITPKPPPPGPVESRQRLVDPAQAGTADRRWAAILGAGLVLAADILVIGALVDDFLLPVAGVADDAPVFAAAAVMLTKGLSMMGGTHTNLPSTDPAHVQARVTVSGSAL